MVLCILSSVVVLGILILPMITQSSAMDLAFMILCLSLVGLGVISLFLELFMDLYKFIPYDLYDCGLTIVIEDKELLRELARRKRMQEENEETMRRLREENERLLREMLE